MQRLLLSLTRRYRVGLSQSERQHHSPSPAAVASASPKGRGKQIATENQYQAGELVCSQENGSVQIKGEVVYRVTDVIDVTIAEVRMETRSVVARPAV